MPVPLRIASIAVILFLPWTESPAQATQALRLHCEGVETTLQMGFGGRPAKKERVATDFVIDPQSGVAQDVSLITLAKMVSGDWSPYVFTITQDAFLWTGEGKSNDSPMNGKSTIKIDRFSGGLTVSEVLMSRIPGKEYIFTRGIEGKCARLTERQF